MLHIQTMSLGPLGTNCYIVHDNTNALIFDPGGDPEKIIQFLEAKHMIPKGILLTHAHFDHIGGVDALRSHFNINVYLHDNEAEWLENPELNRSLIFTRTEVKTKPPEKTLVPGPMNLSSFSFEVVHTPGHSPGSVTFIFKDDSFVISGDVLFQQGVGRTDLPGGSFSELKHSIHEVLYKLPHSFIVYPGHGSHTSIGSEMKNNPYVPG